MVLLLVGAIVVVVGFVLFWVEPLGVLWCAGAADAEHCVSRADQGAFGGAFV